MSCLYFLFFGHYYKDFFKCQVLSDNWHGSEKVDRIRKLMQVGLLVRCHKIAGISTWGLFQFPSCCWDKCDKMSSQRQL